jgi:hypothetical protein
VKAKALVTLDHSEKLDRHGRQTKLFLTDSVKKVAFRKYGMLGGYADERELLEEGKKPWKLWNEKSL